MAVSFAPVVFAGRVGNGDHLHLSLWNRRGRNVFDGGDGPEGMTRQAESFAAGVLASLSAIVGVSCPSVVSYLRLQPHRWSGPWACWGLENREAGLRFVTGMRGDRRDEANLEVKPVDGSANPYLALGAIVAAGLDGLERDLRLPEPVTVDPASLSAAERRKRKVEQLPSSLGAAIAGARALERASRGDGRHAVRLVRRHPQGRARRVRGPGRRRRGSGAPLALLRGETVAGIDLTGVAVVDAHTHPYRLEDLLERDPDGFDTRMMFLGESFASSSQMHDELWPFVHALTGSTVFAIALHRWLAEHLGCESNRQAVVAGAHRGPARRPGRVHQGPAGRGRRRGDPVGRGVPAAADHGAGVRGIDRREGPSRRAPRALDPDAPGGLLRRPRGRRPRRGDAGRRRTRTASRSSRSSPTARAWTSGTRARPRPARPSRGGARTSGARRASTPSPSATS